MSNQHPDIEVRFRTRQGEAFTLHTPVSYNSTRSLNDAYSVASLRFEGLEVEHSDDTTVNGRPWWGEKGVLQKKDLIGIYLRDHNGKLWPDVVGMVNSISIEEGESLGEPSSGVRIVVHGLGRALSDYRIFFHPQLSTKPGLMQGYGLGQGLIQDGAPPSGRPDQVCRTIFERYFNSDYVFRLADGRNLTEAVKLEFSKVEDSLDQMARNINGQDLSVWEALRKFCDSPWNELFLDVDADTGDLLLTLRPTPFTLSDWETLRNREGWSYLYDSDKHRDGFESLMTDEDQVFSWFLCGASGSLSGIQGSILQFNNTNGKLPIYDRDLIEKYGFKPLEKTTQYIQVLDSTSASAGQIDPAAQKNYNSTKNSLFSMLERRTALLYLWFGFDRFLRGTLPMTGRIGRDREWGIRLGSVLTRKRDDLQMYVTGIEQSWNMNGTWQTSVTVERGHYANEYRAWVKKQIFSRGLQDVLGIDT